MKKITPSVLFCFFSILIFTLGTLSAEETFSLVAGGIPQAVFILDAQTGQNLNLEPYSPEKIPTFRKNLDFFNQEISRCGVKPFRIVTEANPNENKIIFHKITRPLIEDDAFSIDFPDRRTMRITCTQRSSRWALNHILQKHFGIQWIFPNTRTAFYDLQELNDYPKCRNLTIPAKRFVQQPYSFGLSRSIDWRSRDWDQNWGSKPLCIQCHFMPIDVFPVWKYAENQSWPEEIMPVVKGRKMVLPKAKKPLSNNPHIAKRGYDVGWMPCYSNPKTAEIAIENILELLKKYPDKKIIAMGINDNGGNYCECELCRKTVQGRRNSANYCDLSIPYYTWMNKVAAGVTRHHPDVLFSASAYREVMDPPPFKLHPNITIGIDFELTTLDDPAVAAKRLPILEKWKNCVQLFRIGDNYSYGLGQYYFPRIYFKSTAKYMKLLHAKYNIRGMFAEASSYHPFEGPKHYMMYKLMENIDADPEKLVMDWCIAAVGAEAAPYLRAYYQFWEDYWTGEDIRKTTWYRSVSSIYMQLGEVPTHTFALKQGDMAKARRLMEKVISLAESDLQKKRAALLMEAFEYSECAATALMSEWIPPDSTLGSPREALNLLRQVPAAFQAIEKMGRNRFNQLGKGMYSKIKGAAISNVSLILPYLSNAEVRSAATRLAADTALPLLLRSQLKIYLGDSPANMIANSSFEKPAPMPTGWGGSALRSKRSSRQAADGKFSLGAYSHLSVEFPLTIRPGKTYMLLFNANAPKGSIEGRLNYMLTLASAKGNTDHIRHLGMVLGTGRWHTFSGVVSVPAKTRYPVDRLRINIWTEKFEPDESIWIDNVRVYCLDDLK